MNIVVTGASKGIGKAITGKYAGANHNVFICARNEKNLRETAEEINRRGGGKVSWFVADLSVREQVAAFGDWVLEHCKTIDVLVNNAGNFIPGSVHNEAEGALEQMMAQNLYSAYHLTRHLLPRMMEQKRGHIFNMCSIAALQAYSNGGSYSMSKFALMGFTKNLREEMKPYRLAVTAVYPGAVYTDSWAATGVDEQRLMEVQDISNLIFTASMLSPAACVEDIVVRPILGDLP